MQPNSEQDCRVCLLPHDEHIHAATERLHGWLKARLETALKPVVAGERGTRTITPHAGYVPQKNGNCWAERPAGRPRSKPQPDHSIGPRGQKPGSIPWNKVEFSAEDVMEAFAAGRSIHQQAVAHKVTTSCISKRLHVGLRASGQLAEKYAAMCVCGCGRPKQPSAASCKLCKAAEKRRESRREVAA